MNLKASKSTFKKENMNLNDYVDFWLLWLFIVAFGLNKKVSCVGLFFGGGVKIILQHLYLNIYEKFFIYNVLT